MTQHLGARRQVPAPGQQERPLKVPQVVEAGLGEVDPLVVETRSTAGPLARRGEREAPEVGIDSVLMRTPEPHPDADGPIGSPTPVAVSWSAGKDSAFALWTLLRDPGLAVVALLTTLTEGYRRVSMSGVREELVEQQARSLGLPLVKVWIPPDCPNAVYEARLAVALGSEQLRGIGDSAFGDLHLADVRAYREERLAAAGRKAHFPLWGRSTDELAREMIAAGFRATIVCVDPTVLPHSFVGRSFDAELLAILPDGVDACGENGEFHTFVWDAPAYAEPVACHLGEVVTRGSFLFADVVPGAAIERSADRAPSK